MIDNSPPISLRWKIALVLAAWMITAFAMAVAVRDWQNVFFYFPIYTLPAYLVNLVFNLASKGLSTIDRSLNASATIGWLYYLALTIGTLAAERRKLFLWLFAILCLSLLINCGGCISVFHSLHGGRLE
jgi:hypothetical protein